MTQFRCHGRRRQRQKVSIRVGDARERDATLENVSFGGARLSMIDPPAEGSIVRLSIATATAWEPLELDAVVRWAHDEAHEETPAPFGVELSPLTPTTALALDEWLETLAYDSPTLAR